MIVLKSNPYLKPFLPVFAAMATIMALDFGALLVTEWLDGNYWSFCIRCAGLVTTIVIGFWVRRAFKQFKASIEPPTMVDGPEIGDYGIGIEYPGPAPDPCAAAHRSFGFARPRCSAVAADGRQCGCHADMRVGEAGYCIWCYVETVEKRLAAHAIV